MNVLAQETNAAIAAVNPNVLEMLSPFGKELFFPRGILSQSAEAREFAHRYNATIGTALEHGTAMNLPSVMKSVSGISPNEALLYAPSTGVPEVRESWKKKILADNPSLSGDSFSLPVPTNGLTHGLSLVGDLFIGPGDTVLLPDMMWGNYKLILELRKNAHFSRYNFFREEGFNVPGFTDALNSACEENSKVVVLLNFPNNPTGYTPTEQEGEAIAGALLDAAEAGTNVVAVTDDAYFGLFYTEDIMRESLFSKLAGKHDRLLAVKADAATKEAFVWGLRTGFLSFSVGGATAESPLYDALVSKTGGAVRSVISNCSRLSQSIVNRALCDSDFVVQRREKVDILKARALKVKQVLAKPEYADAWKPYPFNSGYFMCIELLDVNAERLRVHMLKEYGVGAIAIDETDLRVAFSCLEVDQIEDMFDLLLQGVNDLRQ